MSRRAIPLALIFVCFAGPVNAQFFGLDNIVKGAKTIKQAGDATREIGEAEEIRMGAELASTLLGAAPLVADPALQRYVNRLGVWLAQHSERPGLPWQFGVIDNDGYNAFSTPGGRILITKGLFVRMRTEAELAGVLAHEIAHVVKRHQVKAMQKAMGSEALGSVTSMAASSRGGMAADLAGKVVNSGKEMFVRGLDKDDEYEADRMGVVIAARSGYSPYGLVGALQTLSASPTDGGFALMFKTHPTPSDRLARLGAAMGITFEEMPGLVDDLPSFSALRNPPPLLPLPAQPKTTKPRKKR